jgi:hypothetical protein
MQQGRAQAGGEAADEDVGGMSPIPAQIVADWTPVPAQMRQG